MREIAGVGPEGLSPPLEFRHFDGTSIMPGWLKIVSHLNSLTYVVDALRTFMLAGSTSAFGLSTDYAVILLATTILVCIDARLYPHLAT